MKLLNIKVNGLKLFDETLEIDFLTKQKNMSNNEGDIFNVFKNSNTSAYTNNVLSFIGINASGKTTTLKVLSFVIQMLSGEPINKIRYKDILNNMEDDKVVFDVCFWTEKNEICKLSTTIIKNEEDYNEKTYIGSKEFIISDEKLYVKKDTAPTNKKNILDFENINPKQVRTGEEEYLSEDISIIISTNKNLKATIAIGDLIAITDKNITLNRILRSCPKEFITFLDSSIEYLESEDLKDDKVIFKLKFKNNDEIILGEANKIVKYLSSGTIKGINVFRYILSVLQLGGYLLIDELENHFNKEIVATIIRIFKDSKLNPNGATLIFTTHYPEILDEFERNDSIYIVRNEKGIRVDNLYDLLKRTDLKKSDLYSSDYFSGTAPSYSAYMNMKKMLEKEVEKND